MNITEYVKLPKSKFFIGVITVGAIAFVVANVISTIMNVKQISGQIKINKYQIKEYTDKYGDIDADTIQGEVKKSISNLQKRLILKIRKV